MDVYRKLARYLDKTPGGFPETETGIELKILKQLFTPKEAHLALNMIMIPEEVESIAQRAGMDPDAIEPMLREMAEKGLIIHIAKDNAHNYMLLQFIVGIWEYQVNRLTTELIDDFNKYLPYFIKEQEKHKTQQLRIIPVEKSIGTELNVMDHEHVEKLIRSQSRIWVAPCICRREKTMIGKGCGKMEETCLIFGGGTYIYESRGIGRSITQEEAIEIVRKGVEQGLVAQPSNAVKPFNICLCCDCCCQILSNIKKNPAPAKIVNSNYQARVKEDNCTACGACTNICPMNAIIIQEVASVDTDRCIGCGLCVTVCEYNAILLGNKLQTERWEPPPTMIDTYVKIIKEKNGL